MFEHEGTILLTESQLRAFAEALYVEGFVEACAVDINSDTWGYFETEEEATSEAKTTAALELSGRNELDCRLIAAGAPPLSTPAPKVTP